jgi:hypothetical protein
MSVIGSNILAGASGQGGAYNLTNSLRFRSSASAYLNRTPASASNRKTWTFSTWVKLGEIAASNGTILSAGTTSGESTRFYLRYTGSQFQTGFGSFNLDTTIAVFRDPSAWYHVVIAIDTTQATAANRLKIYVNGVQQSVTTDANYTLNADTPINNNVAQNIGRDLVIPGGYFDGYLAEVNFIDGQALTPSSFGETSPSTGVWIPKKYTGTYGTNGFYLPFKDNASTTTLGSDFSGNSNNWTTNNISLTAGATYDSMTDVPTLTSATAANFCTLNPISNPNGTIVTYSDGNLAFSHSASSGNAPKMTVQGTMALPAGKFYWEYTVGATVNDQVGIGTMLVAGGSADGTAGARYLNNGTFQSGYTNPASAASYTTGDVIGMAYDQPSGTLAFYKNNSLQGTITNISTSEIFFPHRSVNSSGSGGAGVFNFGQRPFAYTPPSGFVALNTFNLPTPTIGATASTQANKNFNILLWTGNATNPRTISGLGFEPDMTWYKSRSGAGAPAIYDDVRGYGAGKMLCTNQTSAEGIDDPFTDTDYGFLTQNSDGIVLNSGNVSGTWVNNNTTTYVGWNWKASGTSVSNTDGSITSTVSANTSAGFSIVTFNTGTAGNKTVGHGLSVTPAMIILKNRDGGTSQHWNVWHQSFSTPSQGYIYLNLTNAVANDSRQWANAAPTSTVFSFESAYTFPASVNMVAYCFAQVAGYSAFGSYTGNGSTDGTFVYLGFRPKYILMKKSSSTEDWAILDSSRSPYNITTANLYADLAGSEDSVAIADLLSNGIKFRAGGGTWNLNGDTYIYMAFAEFPFKYSLGR